MKIEEGLEIGYYIIIGILLLLYIYIMWRYIDVRKKIEGIYLLKILEGFRICNLLIFWLNLGIMISLIIIYYCYDKGNKVWLGICGGYGILLYILGIVYICVENRIKVNKEVKVEEKVEKVEKKVEVKVVEKVEDIEEKVEKVDDGVYFLNEKSVVMNDDLEKERKCLEKMKVLKETLVKSCAAAQTLERVDRLIKITEDTRLSDPVGVLKFLDEHKEIREDVVDGLEKIIKEKV